MGVVHIPLRITTAEIGRIRSASKVDGGKIQTTEGIMGKITEMYIKKKKNQNNKIRKCRMSGTKMRWNLHLPPLPGWKSPLNRQKLRKRSSTQPLLPPSNPPYLHLPRPRPPSERGRRL